jgi:LysR family transcriptional regulator, regulator for metE and metH
METMKTLHAKAAVPEHLEVRHLKLMQAIADFGNVTRAAGQLHLSQSAVSHQLLALERDLGARLFDRVGKRMVPTSAGAHLVDGARRLLGELGELERTASGRRDAKVPLRVTSSCFTSYNWLPTALAHFADRHPTLELDIVLGATRRAIAALIADEVDLAIVTDPPRDDTWTRELVITSELVAVASAAHPICKRLVRGALRWGALNDYPFLVPDIADSDLARLDEAVRSSWAHEHGHRPPTPIPVRKIPLSEALFELARIGAGVVIVDRWVVPKLGRDLRILHLSPNASRTFHAVWRHSNPRGLPIDELVAIVKQAGTKRLRAA